ncbi:hypothetical protein QNI19_31585 [Cytophagaceae bacterium DM2B3-1]|uniref:Porin n=1 Tax=Xanthocytophaga flava TaxID=3048013 RepID=A0ABT7CUS5_9BACT|nr:hypothetical protein [Xanthocytophaga flavus]MDJ1497524.1 hypothetical protein [Xanthocytophaga flavus]
MKKAFLLVAWVLTMLHYVSAQDTTHVTPPANPSVAPKEKDALKFNLNESGSHFFQVTFLNQTWVRWNQSNPGTMVDGMAKSNTFDIGLRRTRIQMFGQITDNVFVYFQFGQNNFNSQYNYNSSGGLNRKNAPFFHDAVGEYKVTKGNQLKLGGGLTIVNGLSRFSQPSVSSIMTLDVPVFAQATVDQIDQFSRKLSIYARGQIGKFDYRVTISDPFPVLSNGSVASKPTANATFAQKGHSHQFQSYLMYQFFEHESHTTPGYMTGTYLGKKKIFNIAAGIITQPNAMWYAESNGDTTYTKMLLWSVESFLDMPVNKGKGTALSVYAGFFNTNYGPNYLRFNGIMNPATSSNATNAVSGAGGTYGNAFPMFGTGKVFYSQLGYLLPTSFLGEKHGQLMPYATWMHASYDRLNGKSMDVIDVGLNWLIKGHNSKISLDYQNRPTYQTDSNGNVQTSDRKGTVLIQYQIFI